MTNTASMGATDDLVDDETIRAAHEFATDQIRSQPRAAYGSDDVEIVTPDDPRLTDDERTAMHEAMLDVDGGSAFIVMAGLGERTPNAARLSSS